MAKEIGEKPSETKSEKDDQRKGKKNQEVASKECV